MFSCQAKEGEIQRRSKRGRRRKKGRGSFRAHHFSHRKNLQIGIVFHRRDHYEKAMRGCRPIREPFFVKILGSGLRFLPPRRNIDTSSWVWDPCASDRKALPNHSEMLVIFHRPDLSISPPEALGSWSTESFSS